MAEQHEKALVPQIRFAGFTDPWEQRKLGELFEEHSEKDRDDLPALTIIQGGGTVHRDESNRNLQFDRNSLSNYKVVDTGDFIVHLRSFEGGLEKATCCGLVSPAYHIFRGKNVDSDFYYLYFRSKRFIDADLKPHVYGIRDGRSIDIEGMKTIFIPWTNLAEQRRIGAFFDHLDSLITLHQRKYDKLCVLKKSMLDKMFPKGGSLYPEIRFAGFTDPWNSVSWGNCLRSIPKKIEMTCLLLQSFRAEAQFIVTSLIGISSLIETVFQTTKLLIREILLSIFVRLKEDSKRLHAAVWLVPLIISSVAKTSILISIISISDQSVLSMRI